MKIYFFLLLKRCFTACHIGMFEKRASRCAKTLIDFYRRQRISLVNSFVTILTKEVYQ